MLHDGGEEEKPRMKAPMYGRPCWIDLSTPDVPAASDFYGELLGWTIERFPTGMDDHDYYIAKVGDHDVGGLMESPAGAGGPPPMWSVFIGVEDVDETTTTAVAAGGTLVQAPFDIPEARLAVIADPTGAVLGLSSGLDRTGAWLSEEPGAASWVELMTRDPAAAEAFYAQVFGWKAETAETSGTMYTTFLLDGVLVAGAMLMPDEIPAEVPSFWTVYFAVADCEVAARRAVELGGEVVRPTMEIEPGRFAVLADPNGAAFQVMDAGG